MVSLASASVSVDSSRGADNGLSVYGTVDIRCLLNLICRSLSQSPLPDSVPEVVLISLRRVAACLHICF